MKDRSMRLVFFIYYQNFIRIYINEHIIDNNKSCMYFKSEKFGIFGQTITKC